MEKENKNFETPSGFYSTDGFFHEMSSLSVSDLEYVSKSLIELECLLAENIALENYEKCAEIRDQIIKRTARQDP
jgi:protein-arginine kinase activator protein McsA